MGRVRVPDRKQSDVRFVLLFLLSLLPGLLPSRLSFVELDLLLVEIDSGGESGSEFLRVEVFREVVTLNLTEAGAHDLALSRATLQID